MGQMNLEAFKEAIRGNLGGRTDLDGRLQNFVNSAQIQIARQFDFRDMQRLTSDTILAGSPDYSLPSVPRQIHTVRLMDGTQSRKLVFIPVRSWDALMSKPDAYSTGRCTHYTTWQQKILVWRIPDNDYGVTIRWGKWPDDLTSSGHCSEYEHKDDIIECFATGWAFKAVGNHDRMIDWSRHGWSALEKAVLAESQHADEDVVPISEIRSPVGEYWANPFVR